MPDEAGSLAVRMRRIGSDGKTSDIERPVATELPIALEFNGVGYAVLMASPDDLVDLAYGFAHSERLVESTDEIVDVGIHPMAQGMVVRVTLVQERVGRVVDRVRHRVSESSCGLCGIENLEQALRPLPRITQASRARATGIFKALAALRASQPLNALTGAVHAAALCSHDGSIRMVREDVGRHNAFDKLLGAMMRADARWDGGFCLLSSRCSYELVEKAALSNCPLLVTVSAPTTLAISRANDAGLPLAVLARSDAILAVHGSDGTSSL
ncbi:MAG: formate dehydrogenase accessory sulfurtransferase FdhD [Sphingobium sp.]|nr:formate dehydrogenase accessory sulfurtransferase FdhD [Sphingobium sp.]